MSDFAARDVGQGDRVQPGVWIDAALRRFRMLVGLLVEVRGILKILGTFLGKSPYPFSYNWRPAATDARNCSPRTSFSPFSRRSASSHSFLAASGSFANNVVGVPVLQIRKTVRSSAPTPGLLVPQRFVIRFQRSLEVFQGLISLGQRGERFAVPPGGNQHTVQLGNPCGQRLHPVRRRARGLRHHVPQFVHALAS